MSELPNRNIIQQRMFKPMPSKNVQRHKYMSIMPKRMLVMCIINHMFIMHIPLYFI